MELRGTTILSVRHKGHVALIGDGQVTMGQSIVMKHTAKKVRRMYKDQIVAGFAGATADAFTLFERFDAHLEQTGVWKSWPRTTPPSSWRWSTTSSSASWRLCSL